MAQRVRSSSSAGRRVTYSRHSQPGEAISYTFDVTVEVDAATIDDARDVRTVVADKIFQQASVLSVRATAPAWKPVSGKNTPASEAV